MQGEKETNQGKNRGRKGERRRVSEEESQRYKSDMHPSFPFLMGNDPHPSKALLQCVQDDELREIQVLLRSLPKYSLGERETWLRHLQHCTGLHRLQLTLFAHTAHTLTMLFTFFRMFVRPLMTSENLYLEMCIRQSLLCSVLTLV